jgi:hypothetical protein
MTLDTYNELWNSREFCIKRWKEQIEEGNRIILNSGTLSKERFNELLESSGIVLERFGKRITELTPQPLRNENICNQ